MKQFVQPQSLSNLTVNQPNDRHEQEADRMSSQVMQQATPNQFFSAAPKSIQREENEDQTGKVITEGAGVVYEQLEENAAFEAWKERQTEMLKYKLWDSQGTDFKAGIIGFGLLNAGILGSTFAMDPTFRAGSIDLLQDTNLLLPLKLIPYSEYFGLSSFKYTLPGAESAPYTFETEFEMDAWFDLMRKEWNLPKVGLSFGTGGSYTEQGGFDFFTGGNFKLKMGGGIINLQGFYNQTLPAVPMLVSDPSKGEAPTWIMRSLPGQLEENLPKGSGVFLTIDVWRLFNGNQEKEKPEYNKSVEVNRKENNSGAIQQGAGHKVAQVLSSGQGQALDNNTRHFMENRFNQDFSRVRIHTNEEAVQSAQSLNAKAYTSGQDIVFDTNKYQPGTDTGNKLLAHELTHVVQQTGSKKRK